MATTNAPITTDDIVAAVNSVGFDLAGLTTALGLVKAIVDAGFSDPGPFTKVLISFKLQNDKWKLQQEAAALQIDQQQQVNNLIATTNPAIGEKNNQIAAIDAQLAQLQG